MMLFLSFILSLNADLILNDSNFKVFYEKKFDMEIEQVAFDSYLENGYIKYYPKIVVFRDVIEVPINKTLPSGKRLVGRREMKELRILTPRVETVKSIRGLEKAANYADVKVLISEKGSYFFIFQDIRMSALYDTLADIYLSQEERIKLEKSGELKDILKTKYLSKYESEYGEIPERRVSFYNDIGELLWRKDPYTFDSKGLKVSNIYICPKDGKIFLGRVGEGSDVMVYSLYDSQCNKIATLPSLPSVSYNYLPLEIAFSKNWEYTLIGFHKYPLHRYSELPGKSSEPGIILLDSLWNILWEKYLDEYLLTWMFISPKGSYIGVGTHTMKGTKYHGRAESVGRLFNREGNFVMEIPWGGIKGPNKIYSFSENEKYYATPKEKNQFIIIDLEEERILFKKDFPSEIESVSVSNTGESIILIKEKNKKMIYLLDRVGEIIWKGSLLQEKTKIADSKRISYTLLDWNKRAPIIGVVNNEKREIKIIKIIIEGEEK